MNTECAYGHTVRRVGCVSCVLVFDRAIPALPIDQPPQPQTPREAPHAKLARDAVRLMLASVMPWEMDSESIGAMENVVQMACGAAVESALLAASVREQELAELMSQKLAACDVAALSNTPQTYGPPLHRANPFWSVAYESVRAAVLREMQNRDRAEQAESSLAALREALLALAPHPSQWESLTNEQIIRTRLVSVESFNQAHDALAALREALTALLAQSGDPNAATGEFDTAAGRARRLLNAHAPSDPAASVKEPK